MTAAPTAIAVPIVDYLVLGERPHLVASACTSCAATYFDRRNACASCGRADFTTREVPTAGEVVSFTIVHFAAPGVPVPFVAAVIDCEGVRVRANLVNVAPDPEHVTLGMQVRLSTYSLGRDTSGAEGIGFGFEPV